MHCTWRDYQQRGDADATYTFGAPQCQGCTSCAPACAGCDAEDNSPNDESGDGHTQMPLYLNWCPRHNPWQKHPTHVVGCTECQWRLARRHPRAERGTGEPFAYQQLRKAAQHRASYTYQLTMASFGRYTTGRDWRGALDCLPFATYEEDELAQNAAYHMADCSLELGDRARA